jgi:hypothetical protein
MIVTNWENPRIGRLNNEDNHNVLITRVKITLREDSLCPWTGHSALELKVIRRK